MIDFRYHLVSLVSVFMALAIGVVLGAGPLKEPIGESLTSQVQGLREDKDALQQAVENRDDAVAQRDEAITTLGAAVTDGSLSDRSVALITLPGAVGADVEALATRLGEAGATVSSTVALQPTWAEPDQQEARDEVTDDLLPFLLSTPDGSGTQVELAALLARAVLSNGGGTRDVDGQAVLDALVEAGLVTVDETEALRADLAVVVTGAPGDSAGVGDEAWTEAELESVLALVSAADDASAGALLTGPPSAATDGGLIAALRADADVAAEVSSVDVLDSPMGRIGVVLGLVQQAAGGVGHYGVGAEAASVLPPVPADGSDGSDDSDGSGGGTPTTAPGGNG